MQAKSARQRAAPLQPHSVGWRIGPALALLGLTLVLLLAACSRTGGPPPPPLPDLHLPGVTRIPGLANVPTKLTPGHFVSVATYPPANGALAPRVLFVIDGALYDVGLDGSGLRQVPVPEPCGFVSATGDGHWAACQDDGGSLEFIALTASPPDGGHLASFDNNASVFRAVLSPDGQDVAGFSPLGGGCSIAVYATSPALGAFQLRAILSLPEFVDPGPPVGCAVAGVSWSPDEAWLAVGADTTSTPGVYALPLASPLPGITQPAPPTTQPIIMAVLPTQLMRLGTATLSAWEPAWSMLGGALAVTFVGRGGRSIVRVNLATHEQTTLLTIPEGDSELSAVAWTADSRHLVFSISVPWCGDCLPPLGSQFELYVCTPPM